MTILVLACPPGGVPKRPDLISPGTLVTHSASPRRIERINHPSGLTILLQTHRVAPVVAAQVWVAVGSGDESEQEAGLAHVHEHMLFKGTERRSVGEIAGEIEGAGGKINAWTSFDQTVYHITMPSRFAEAGLDVLLDAVRNPAFDPDELERELEVIQEEILQGEDQPARALSRALFEESFQEHPYGRPVIGTQQSVARYDRKDVRRFFDRWYVPTNMTLVVVGDIDRESVERAVSAIFGNTPQEAPVRPVRPVEPRRSEPVVRVQVRDVQEAMIAIGFPGPSLYDERTPQLQLLSLLLGGGDSSILHERIQRDQELTTSVWSSLYSPSDPGLMTVGASFTADQQPEQIVSAIMTELAWLGERKLPASELRRTLTMMESSQIYAGQTVQGIAQRIGYFHVVAGDLEFEDKFLDLAAAADPERIRELARELFDSEQAVLSLVIPESMENAGLEDRLLVALRSGAGHVARESGGQQMEPDSQGVFRATLPNGLRLIVQPDTAAPLFAVRATVMGGVLAEEEANNGMSNIMAELLTAGTRRRSASAISREADSIAASLNGFSGQNSIGLGMNALSRDFDTAMDLFADALLHSTFPQSELDRVRRETLASLATRHDSPAVVAIDMFREVALVGHPYAMLTAGSSSSVESLERTVLLEAYERLINPARMTLSIVGDVDPEQVFQTVARLFDVERPAAPTLMMPATTPQPIEAPVVRGVHRDRQQSHILLGFQSEPADGPLRDPLDVLSTALGGQGGRLFVELRDRQSLAYSVSVHSNAGFGAGYFFFYASASPTKVEQVVQAFGEEIERVRRDGITEAELVRAKRIMIGGRDISLQRAGSRATFMGFDELVGRGYDHFRDYADRIEAVTLEDVREAAARYLDPGHQVTIVVGPGGADMIATESAGEGGEPGE